MDYACHGYFLNPLMVIWCNIVFSTHFFLKQIIKVSLKDVDVSYLWLLVHKTKKKKITFRSMKLAPLVGVWWAVWGWAFRWLIIFSMAIVLTSLIHPKIGIYPVSCARKNPKVGEKKDKKGMLVGDRPLLEYLDLIN